MSVLLQQFVVLSQTTLTTKDTGVTVFQFVNLFLVMYFSVRACICLAFAVPTVSCLDDGEIAED